MSFEEEKGEWWGRERERCVLTFDCSETGFISEWLGFRGVKRKEGGARWLNGQMLLVPGGAGATGTGGRKRSRNAAGGPYRRRWRRCLVFLLPQGCAVLCSARLFVCLLGLVWRAVRLATSTPASVRPVNSVLVASPTVSLKIGRRSFKPAVRC